MRRRWLLPMSAPPSRAHPWRHRPCRGQHHHGRASHHARPWRLRTTHPPLHRRRVRHQPPCPASRCCCRAALCVPLSSRCVAVVAPCPPPPSWGCRNAGCWHLMLHVVRVPWAAVRVGAWPHLHLHPRRAQTGGVSICQHCLAPRHHTPCMTPAATRSRGIDDTRRRSHPRIDPAPRGSRTPPRGPASCARHAAVTCTAPCAACSGPCCPPPPCRSGCTGGDHHHQPRR